MSTKTKCHCCAGTGQEQDQESIGRRQRQLREDAGIALRSLAKRLGLSHTYLTLLEQGKRKWTPELVLEYVKEIEK